MNFLNKDLHKIDAIASNSWQHPLSLPLIWIMVERPMGELHAVEPYDRALELARGAASAVRR
jgi:hypothetical protein